MFGVNPYDPFGMMAGQPGQMWQPPMQTQQAARQGVQTAQNGPGWVTVPTVQDIANVSVQPGVKAWIMAQNDAVFAVRAADQTGVTTTEYYRFERYDPAAEKAASEKEEYVTRKEFQALIDSLGGAANDEPTV